MRTGLIVFGILLLMFGAVLYVVPSPTAQAVSTTVDQNDATTRTTYSTVTVPWQAVLIALLAGAVLFIVGLILPGPHVNVTQAPESGRVVERTDRVETVNGGRKTVTERHEQHLRRTE